MSQDKGIERTSDLSTGSVIGPDKLMVHCSYSSLVSNSKGTIVETNNRMIGFAARTC